MRNASLKADRKLGFTHLGRLSLSPGNPSAGGRRHKFGKSPCTPAGALNPPHPVQKHKSGVSKLKRQNLDPNFSTDLILGPPLNGNLV